MIEQTNDCKPIKILYFERKQFGQRELHWIVDQLNLLSSAI